MRKILFTKKKKRDCVLPKNVNVTKDKGCGIFPDLRRPERHSGNCGFWSSTGSCSRGERAVKGSIGWAGSAGIRQRTEVWTQGNPGERATAPWLRGPSQPQRRTRVRARMRTTLPEVFLINNRACVGGNLRLCGANDKAEASQRPRCRVREGRADVPQAASSLAASL